MIHTATVHKQMLIDDRCRMPGDRDGGLAIYTTILYVNVY